ncbi:MAG: hypothetical protein KAT68_18235 [Bacteroidales bacterium]|nr:hypothetical protein [Bacteroidales bacterium]
MNRKIFLKIILTVIVSTFVFYSCIKDNLDFDKLNKKIEWNPSLAVPLVYTSLTISDMLQDYDSAGMLYEDPTTQILTLVYNQKIFSNTAEDFIKINDQQYGETFTKTDYDNAGGFNNNTVQMIKDDVKFPFGVFYSQLIDSMLIKSANLNINVTSTFDHTGELVITFPGMIKNDESYSKTIDINTSSGNFTFNETFTDLDGYFLDLSGFDFTSNSIFINYKLTLYDSGSGNVTGGNGTNISIDLTDIKYDFLFGYLGHFLAAIPQDSIFLKVFNKASEGSLCFQDPKFTISILNSMGLPIQLGFNNLKSYSNLTETYMDIEGDSIPTLTSVPPFFINRPYFDNYNEINPIETTILLDSTGCNINEVLSTLPKYIYYGVDYIINPDTIEKDINNFIAGNSIFDVGFNVEIPLYGYAEYFALQDTMEVDLSKTLKNSDKINSALFRIEANNGMPHEIEMQLYFLNSLDTLPVDSLFGTQNERMIIEAGVTQNGRVDQETGKTSKISDIIFSNERINKLENVKFLMLKAVIRTSNFDDQESVKYYPDYHLDIKLGIQIEAYIDEL